MRRSPSSRAITLTIIIYGETTTCGPYTPIYAWWPVDGVQWYQIWEWDDADHTALYPNGLWVNAGEANCASGICCYTPQVQDLGHPDASYTWWIKTTSYESQGSYNVSRVPPSQSC